MMTIQEEIRLDNQIEKVAALIPLGYRFVTMTVVDCGTHFDVFYHFDRDYELYTLYLKLEQGEKLNSITPVCFAAVIVENEIQDLFGIEFVNLALDYEKHFLLTKEAPAKPFCRVPGVSVETVDAKGGAQ